MQLTKGTVALPPLSRTPNGTSADLYPGQRRVLHPAPAYRVSVTQRLLARDRDTVDGKPVPALVGNPPAACGKREPGVLPGHRRHVGQRQLNRAATGPGAGHRGFGY